ncbi:hypothetical protein OIU85_005832 [Salix viminalis]|uniref:Uncharacterized protein n=1 Tax=Salix viminalis TaxID=40686 RepID=A0A9Q0PK36_SALVM|nr:hypothetical protein OIU85_005832 [Salix viminalis]
MNSTLATYFLHLKTPSSFNLPSLHHSTTLKSHNSTCTSSLKIPLAASSSSNQNSKNPLTQTLKTLAKTAILIDVAASIAGKFPVWPAKAETPAALTERNPTLEEEQEEEDIEKHQNQNQSDPSTPLQAFP